MALRNRELHARNDDDGYKHTIRYVPIVSLQRGCKRSYFCYTAVSLGDSRRTQCWLPEYIQRWFPAVFWHAAYCVRRNATRLGFVWALIYPTTPFKSGLFIQSYWRWQHWYILWCAIARALSLSISSYFDVEQCRDLVGHSSSFETIFARWHSIPWPYLTSFLDIQGRIMVCP